MLQFEIENNKKNLPYNKNVDIVRLNNENLLDEKNNKLLPNENIKDLVNRSKKGYTSPSKYLQDKSYLNHLAITNSLSNRNYKNLENQLRPINENDDENEKVEDNYNNNKINTEKNNDIRYENWVYKINENKKMKKYYLVLVNKDTYYINRRIKMILS
jgi:hypothetical protein